MRWPPRVSPRHHAAPVTRRRAGALCAYCHVPMTRVGKLMATRDHAFPKHRGFRLLDLNGLNKVYACQGCNASKKGLDVVEWWWRLKSGADRRAPIVFEVITSIWRAGCLPEGIGEHFDAARELLGKGEAA